ncbi:MAG: metalloregulator ArsR/SmtB family transcription factor [Coriobacteriia bacterium]|nr:metalloregulator ArsR/SmtB family transcription factor [Coriobacteriia bacterium]
MAEASLEHVKADPAQFDLVFKALASQQRREILRVLGAGDPSTDHSCCVKDDVCACHLSDRLGLAASTISHHMTILRNAGLVTARKEGLWVHYGLRRDVLAQAATDLGLY